MAYTIKTEADRLPAAADFARRQIEEIDRELHELDYSEDVNGNLVYTPGFYGTEKSELNHSRRQWEILLQILSAEGPTTVQDW